MDNIDSEITNGLTYVESFIEEYEFTAAKNILEGLDPYNYIGMVESDAILRYKNPANGRTLLHSLCRLKFNELKNYEMNNKLDVMEKVPKEAVDLAALLIEKSLFCNEESVNNILVIPDLLGNTPLHIICGNRLSHEIPDELLYLICSYKNRIGCSFKHLLSLKNSHGLTPLHMLFQSQNYKVELLEYVMSHLISDDVIGKNPLITDYFLDKDAREDFNDGQNPILLGDVDGDLPIHYACSAILDPKFLRVMLDPLEQKSIKINSDDEYNYNCYNSSHVRKQRKLRQELSKKFNCEVLNKSCGFVERLTQKSLFCLGTDLMLPVTSLFLAFLEREDIMGSWLYLMFNYRSVFNYINQFSGFNEYMDNVDIHSVDELLQLILDNYDEANAEENTQVSVLKTFVRNALWPRLEVILRCATQSTCYSISPIHLASAVPSFPSFVIKVAQIVMDRSNFLLKDIQGKTPLHVAVSVNPRDFYVSSSSKKLKKASPEILKSAYINNRLWESEREPKSLIQYLVEQEPNAVMETDKYGQLPLHVAIKTGLNYTSSMKPLLDIHTEGILSIDPITNLYPFMLAAIHADLDATFELLLGNPTVLSKRLHSICKQVW